MRYARVVPGALLALLAWTGLWPVQPWARALEPRGAARELVAAVWQPSATLTEAAGSLRVGLAGAHRGLVGPRSAAGPALGAAGFAAPAARVHAFEAAASLRALAPGASLLAALAVSGKVDLPPPLV